MTVLIEKEVNRLLFLTSSNNAAGANASYRANVSYKSLSAPLQTAQVLWEVCPLGLPRSRVIAAGLQSLIQFTAIYY